MIIGVMKMKIISLILLVLSALFFLLVRRKNVIEWLVCVCAEAERTYGSGTGYIKLRDVYSEFVRAYPILSVIMPFEYFSYLVDKALVHLRKKLDENKAISEAILG